MGFLQEGDAEKFLKNSKIVDEIVNNVVKDPRMVNDLADEVADQLEDLIEEDGGLMNKILSAASENKEFRNRVVKQLSTKLS
ncbi:MAG: hypothetical protein IH899_00435 [Planctomycetes bacterium]|nr:hypothetical protein [Planctomycetota bacterium]